MKIQMDWIGEFVDIDESADSLSEKLLMHGLECRVVSGNVLEIEVLPNRGDCLSVIGIAREICALNNKPLKSLESKVPETGENISSILNVEVMEPDLCPRYCARIIKNVKIGPSPSWVTERLINAGMRPINNIVDATNYMMLECGQPFHAFDFDKVADKKIIIRKSFADEKITTLDKTERELPKDILVICDLAGPLAIAGVMGGERCEVSSLTQNIILESAYFDSVSVSNASKILRLRTESSQRFEKGIDFGSVKNYLDRLTNLILRIAGGNAAPGSIDIKNIDRKPKEINLRLQKIIKILGVEIPKENVLTILKGLGFAAIENGEILTVQVPLFREKDIEREIDLIEEIARIWGYDKIRETYPCSLNISADDKEIKNILARENNIRDILTSSGFFEAVTYSMIDEKLLKRANIPISNCVKITNPLIEEMTHLRPSIIPGLLNAVEYNLNRKINNAALFEIGKVFYKDDINPKEKTSLAGIFTGERWSGIIDKKKIDEDFYYLKGILENIFRIFAGEIKWANIANDEGFLDPSRSANIFYLEKHIGFLGAINKKTQNNFSIIKDAFVFAIDLDILNQGKTAAKIYKAIPKYPSVSRDIAMFIPQGLSHKDIADCILSAGQPLIYEVELFDRFKGKDKTSLAYSLKYRSTGKTLVDEEVNIVHKKVLLSLSEKLKVEIR